jgi:hypothetical protein
MSDMLHDDGIDPGAPASGDSAAGSSPAGTSPEPTDGQGDRQSADGGRGWIPPHRFSEVTSANRRLQQENEQLKQRFSSMEGEFGRLRSGLSSALGQEPGQQVDPQVARIREQMLQVFPELKQVIERSKDLEGVLESYPSVQSHMTATTEQLARTAFATLGESLKPHYADPTTGEIDPLAARIFQQGFIDYLQSDPKAYARYVRGDQALVGEWFGRVENALIGRVRRNALAGVQHRGSMIAALPRVGQSTSVVPSQAPPKPKSVDEAIEAAWNDTQS